MKPLAALLFGAVLLLLSADARGQEPWAPDSVLEAVAAGEAVVSDSISACGFFAVDLSDAVTPPESYLKPDSLLRRPRVSLYALPYSLTTNEPDWKRLWINTAVFAGAYVGTLVVLECLPEGATNWNRATIQSVPPFKRWWKNVVKMGPEIDGDNPIFNYVLHPYAGAVYFMSARSCGFNFWRSFLYSACISTIGWEFGIEGFMERPSIQDIFITPIVGSALGECFYILKRHIVSHDYTLWGSRILGNVLAFIVDPVNEVVGLFGGNEARRLHLGHKPFKVESTLAPAFFPTGQAGFTFTCRF